MHTSIMHRAAQRRWCLVVIASILTLPACRKQTEYGECIGWLNHEDPRFEYQYSIRNIILGTLMSETIVVPAIVALWGYKCPEGMMGRTIGVSHTNTGGERIDLVEMSTPKAPTSYDPPLSTEEQQRMAAALQYIFINGDLNDSAVSQAREVLTDFQHRTGVKLSKAQYQWAGLGLMPQLTNCKVEFGKSLLLSWDKRRRLTTSGYDKCVLTFSTARPAPFAEDSRMLAAASEHTTYVDAEGNSNEMDRSDIVRGLNMIKRKQHAVELFESRVADLLRD
jgi:hypothetical protein